MKKRIIDTHCDTLMAYCQDNAGFCSGTWDVTFDKMSANDTYLGTFAMYFSATDTPEQRAEQAVKYAEAYAHLLENHAVSPIRSAAELEQFAQQGGNGILLSIENACFFEDDVNDLKKYWDMGVRMISFTHFKDSQYGCGNAVNDTPEQDTGLTERGRRMVGLVEETGMIIDVSHLSFKSFWDVCEEAKRPFIASHSNAHAVCGHGRNVKDDMFAEIMRRGGLIGMCFCPPFVAGEEPITVEQMADHVDHLCGLGGQDNICIGGDLDGIGDMKVAGLEDCANTWNLAEALLRRNYSEELVDKIMFGNAYAFLKKWLPV
ncbi:MAG: hypothetical protein GXX99_05765 [Clostridiales bacterium]|nr:hypothetical protein [Clostridiales bacterium]